MFRRRFLGNMLENWPGIPGQALQTTPPGNAALSK